MKNFSKNQPEKSKEQPDFIKIRRFLLLILIVFGVINSSFSQISEYSYGRTNGFDVDGNRAVSLDFNQVRILEFNGTTWQPTGYINTVAQNSIFTVVSGNTIAVSGETSLEIYEKINNQWLLQENFNLPPGISTGFDYPIAMDGSRIIFTVVEVVAGDYQGYLYIYEKVNNVWKKVKEIKSNFSQNNYFDDIAISGNRIVATVWQISIGV